MPRKGKDPNQQYIDQALRNGAEIVGEAPVARQVNTAPRGAEPGQFLDRLTRAGGLGWRWIETDDGERYRWRGPAGELTEYMDYDTATAYAAKTPPGRVHDRVS